MIQGWTPAAMIPVVSNGRSPAWVVCVPRGLLLIAQSQHVAVHCRPWRDLCWYGGQVRRRRSERVLDCRWHHSHWVHALRNLDFPASNTYSMRQKRGSQTFTGSRCRLLQYFFYEMPLTFDLLVALPIVVVSMVLHISYPVISPRPFPLVCWHNRVLTDTLPTAAVCASRTGRQEDPVVTWRVFKFLIILNTYTFYRLRTFHFEHRFTSF